MFLLSKNMESQNLGKDLIQSYSLGQGQKTEMFMTSFLWLTTEI